MLPIGIPSSGGGTSVKADIAEIEQIVTGCTVYTIIYYVCGDCTKDWENEGKERIAAGEAETIVLWVVFNIRRFIQSEERNVDCFYHSSLASH